ncbi:MAG TPA: S8 family serine peptidase [Steroidobacteraceae bacterium]|nr:S8 family serine peptidase [Steroidobacteraceae bacterium]
MAGAVGSRAASAAGVLALLAAFLCAASAFATPLSDATRTRLGTHQPVLVIVEFDVAAVDEVAARERARRHLTRDDAVILEMRARGYASIKRQVESREGGADARRVRDYTHLPLALWRLSSLVALARLQSDPLVKRVDENTLLHPDSVSDLAFIDQPQAAAEGATGAGTTIAVIDGGLGSNYLDYSDFGTCTAVATPPATCRVVFNVDYYPGASDETEHGTNVSAIALGVAPGSNLAMFDVFDGSEASSADILTAIDTAIQDQAQYNIVAINLSLGDGSSNSSPCPRSPFASAVTSAANAGITTVAAAGNSGSKTGLGDPACAPGAVSVGAVYNGSYGAIEWETSSTTTCTDATTAPDLVTCFSQSASYLTLLGPGTFVSAPSSSFDLSGTSQATPHVSGSVAVLRARYPAEPLSETVQRLQLGGDLDTDPANNQTTPRVDLLAATDQGTVLTLSGTGPSSATDGGSGTYSLTAANGGPLLATDVVVTDALPQGATFVSASPGCSFAGATVICRVSSLASGDDVTFTINVSWTVTGAVYDTASLAADQTDTAPPSQQMLAFGAAPASTAIGDAPLPVWSYLALAVALGAIAAARQRAA